MESVTCYNPFRRLKVDIPEDVEKFIRVVYERSMRVSPSRPLPVPVMRKAIRSEKARIKTAANIVVEKLREIAYNMPFVDDMHPFYRELLSIFVDIGEYRRALGHVKAVIEVVRKIEKECLYMLTLVATPKDAANVRKAFFGRVADVLRSLDSDFRMLRRAVDALRKLPDIDPEFPTIVVAGMPNVGKSSIVRRVSTAKPEVKEYPFTTRKLVLGHIRLGHDFRIQIMDTPGLLDRPLSERNEIELQAILALKHLARKIIFVVDPTGHSGFDLASQINLLKEIREYFPKKPMVIAINKADLATQEQIAEAKAAVSEVCDAPMYVVSAETGQGLRKMIMDTIKDMLDEVILKEYERYRREVTT